MKTKTLLPGLLMSLVMTFLCAAGFACAEEIPEKFDPRPDGVAAIREQYWGTCWAFGGISSLESYLIKEGLADTDIELSVEDVLWWCNGNPNLHGFVKRSRNDGGHSVMTAGYLETMGARLAEDIPYFGKPEGETVPEGEEALQPDMSEYYGFGDNQLPENFETAPVVFEVTDIIYLNSAAPEEVKEIIMEYGALTVSLLDDPDLLCEETATYWNPQVDLYAESNHMVSIVGWDDNYPREYFLEVNGIHPEKDGAWLVKNCYGTEYGSEGGFLSVSYDDPYILTVSDERDFMYAIAGAREPLSLKRYLCDEFGAVSSLKAADTDRAVIANVYEFGAGETLAEISFVTWSEGAAYQLFYAPVKDDVPVADEGQWKLLAEGTIDFSGYMTVELDESAQDKELPEGDGAIVLALTGDHLEFGVDENLLHNGRPFYNAIIDENTSFILKDQAFVPAEKDWITETMEYTAPLNFSLRAYTR